MAKGKMWNPKHDTMKLLLVAPCLKSGRLLCPEISFVQDPVAAEDEVIKTSGASAIYMEKQRWYRVRTSHLLHWGQDCTQDGFEKVLSKTDPRKQFSSRKLWSEGRVQGAVLALLWGFVAASVFSYSYLEKNNNHFWVLAVMGEVNSTGNSKAVI